MKSAPERLSQASVAALFCIQVGADPGRGTLLGQVGLGKL